jgi:hypothetical protein
MSGPALDYVYRYPQPSQLADAGLLLATCGAPGAEAPPPFFFRGTLAQPRVIADLLLALSRVVGSRFHIPPAMLARILREADPVVTVSEDRLRFEGFSACCSTYARADLLPEALDGTMLAHGTTNVDPQARAYLEGLDGSGKAAALAKALLALKPGQQQRDLAAAHALAGRLERAERWRSLHV